MMFGPSSFGWAKINQTCPALQVPSPRSLYFWKILPPGQRLFVGGKIMSSEVHLDLCLCSGSSSKGSWSLEESPCGGNASRDFFFFHFFCGPCVRTTDVWVCEMAFKKTIIRPRESSLISFKKCSRARVDVFILQWCRNIKQPEVAKAARKMMKMNSASNRFDPYSSFFTIKIAVWGDKPPELSVVSHSLHHFKDFSIPTEQIPLKKIVSYNLKLVSFIKILSSLLINVLY